MLQALLPVRIRVVNKSICWFNYCLCRIWPLYLLSGDRPTFSSTPLLQPYLLDELLKCFSIKGKRSLNFHSRWKSSYCKHSSHTTSRVGFKYLFSSRPIISLAIEGLPNCSGLLIKWLWEGEMKIKNGLFEIFRFLLFGNEMTYCIFFFIFCQTSSLPFPITNWLSLGDWP